MARTQEEAAKGKVSHPEPPALLDKPAAPLTPPAPIAPSNSNVTPVVTEESQNRVPGGRIIYNFHTGET